MKRNRNILIFGGFFIFIGYLIWHVLLGVAAQNKASKEALTQIHNNIQLGNSQDIVSDVIDKFKTERNRVRKDVSSDTWEIGMPFEFGAGDWVLYIQFDSDGFVSAVAMRTSDGIFTQPRGSPEDKGNFKQPSYQD